MKKEKPTTKICKHCQSEIPYKAKICPHCRKKQGANGCLTAILVVALLGLAGSCLGSSDNNEDSKPVQKAESTVEETTQVIEYTAYTVDEMIEDLDNNPMNASDKYKNQYIEITGKLSVIDSDGKYISLHPNDDFAIIGVQCYLQTDEQKDIIKTLSIGDMVTLRGKCTSVGEVLGYSLDIDSID